MAPTAGKAPTGAGARSVYGFFALACTITKHVAALVFFSVGEEFGWRGFAYPRLSERFESQSRSMPEGIWTTSSVHAKASCALRVLRFVVLAVAAAFAARVLAARREA